MNPCKECIVDMICIKECPIFKIDLKRLQTDEEVYLKRCMNNIEDKTYKISKNVEVEISQEDITWYKNGKCHRENDQPAVITSNGSKHWFKNGKIHRDNDQPGLIYSNGIKYWYKDGDLHRDNDQPAIIFYSGVQRWYKDGVRYEPM